MVEKIQQSTLSTSEENGVLTATVSGDWTIDHAEFLNYQIAQISPDQRQPVRIDCQALSKLDTAGAIMLRDLTAALAPAGPVERVNLTPKYDHLLALVENSFSRADCSGPDKNWAVEFIVDIGKGVENFILTLGELIGFFGHVLSALVGVVIRPWRFRLKAMVHQLEIVGLRALGIVGLITFLIGAVIVNQGAIQLAKFGADIFVIDMLGITHLRELGVLLTAIIIAGRSGSAFTAQIGSMKLREEVDAMQTLGLDPMEVLVIPRLLALMIAMPLLTVYADIMGILGGATMAYVQLDISFGGFLSYLQEEVPVIHYWVGVIKAPVFAAVIAVSGCYHGLKVESSAESLGYHTTLAVVQSIFLVIILDAAFAVFFTTMDM